MEIDMNKTRFLLILLTLLDAIIIYDIFFVGSTKTEKIISLNDF